MEKKFYWFFFSLRTSSRLKVGMSDEMQIQSLPFADNFILLLYPY